ncbi:protein ORAOV1 [Parachaetomium inaequale]|uniref:Protein ORAOV1 n=1 Tax=Parachaetomium inaequale TaxID=2588326 RepID=A0AAN6SM82_9PEZI|nr:protein ORAOV1 [Parachaetomium inaequale]
MATSTSTAPTPTQQGLTDDPFDTLLTLEDQFYTEGYNQGMADGLVAGRAEGRQLGLERGFQKFAESGRLQGRAIVWACRGRLGQASSSSSSSSSPGLRKGSAGGGEGTRAATELPPLPDNPRLAKHITTLYALAETESLSTENNDEAVDDFDDRLRRAQGRFKVIERMVGEGESGRSKGGEGHGHDPGAGSGKGEGVVDV